MVVPIPGPGAPDEEFEDLGVAEPDLGWGPEPELAGPAPVPAGDAGPAEPDPEPAHARKNWREKRGPGRPPKAGRITVPVRNDINAKISFALEIPGRVWAARDPACGGMFVQQRGDIADALTEIVCQSPDLVAWFTGTGGAFMLWLNLAAACWPVATVVMAHHVYHSLEGPGEDVQQPDFAQYAA